jgi:hypothetical protein
MNQMEKDILKDTNRLPSVNYLLHNHQFSEEFLAKTIEYYDSWICLRTQKNLTPAFCFEYLYDNNTDSADNWTDFADILKYFQKQWPEKPESELKSFLEAEFQKAMNKRILRKPDPSA